jgi:hypothetical protein
MKIRKYSFIDDHYLYGTMDNIPGEGFRLGDASAVGISVCKTIISTECLSRQI